MIAIAVLTAAVAVAAVALPAQGSERSEVQALRKRVAVLSAKVRALERRSRSLQGQVRGLSVSLRAASKDKEILRTAFSQPPTCPITVPNGDRPAGAAASRNWHGGPDLWLLFWPRGVVVPGDGVLRDGALTIKLGWWRRSPARSLTISGRRLDGESSFSVTRSADGYGETGPLPSGVTFPSGGCWELTGTAGTASLRVVVLVLLPVR